MCFIDEVLCSKVAFDKHCCRIIQLVFQLMEMTQLMCSGFFKKPRKELIIIAYKDLHTGLPKVLKIILTFYALVKKKKMNTFWHTTTFFAELATGSHVRCQTFRVLKVFLLL